MKNRPRPSRFYRLPIVPCGGWIPYSLLLGAVFFLTQTVRTSLTAVLMAFLLAFAGADVLLLFLSLPAIVADFGGAEVTVIRKRAATITVRLRNRGPIPVSFAEASFVFPCPDGKSTETVGRHLTLPPFSSIIVEMKIRFDRRGRCRVGAEELLIYDFLRLFRVKKPLQAGCEVTVLPQSLPSVGFVREQGGGEEASASLLELSAVPDYGDIREYRPGDGMKRIHWKLSSKKEELQVRKYASESERSLWVFCDAGVNADLFASDEDRCEAADRVIEEACAVVGEAIGRSFHGSLYLNGVPSLCYPFGKHGEKEALLTALAEPRELDAALPSDTARFGESGMICVFPFVSLPRGEMLLQWIKRLSAGKVTVGLVDLRSLVVPSRKEAYERELDAFCQALGGLAVTTVLSARKEERP